MNDHTVKSYDEELAYLAGLIARMGGLAEAQFAAAIQALARHDDDLAQRVINGDARIDELDQEVQSFAVRLLALRQPMAGDLRLIVGALNISGEIERIGDYAANIAKRCKVLDHLPVSAPVGGIARLGELVRGLIKDVLDAYLDRDVAKALRVWSLDEEVDAAYNTVFQDIINGMSADPGTITASAHLLFVAKNIERVGDHATNIAESLHYQILGTPPHGDRPKGNTVGAPE
jgi:phosphate transport system protein